MGQPAKRGDVVADRRIVGQVELAAPAIGLEPERDRAVVAPREDRAGVAEPDIAVARRNEVSAAPPERGTSGGFSLGAIDQQPHAVSVRKRAHHGRHVAPRRFEIAVPLAAGLAGQAVQIAFCGAHSGASEIGLSVTETVMSPLLWVAGSANQAASAEIMAVCLRPRAWRAAKP